ncbi:hypothetical protein BJX64DRAFT_254703 [Aspergillus heterothallicus]
MKIFMRTFAHIRSYKDGLFVRPCAFFFLFLPTLFDFSFPPLNLNNTSTTDQTTCSTYPVFKMKLFFLLSFFITLVMSNVNNVVSARDGAGASDVQNSSKPTPAALLDALYN